MGTGLDLKILIPSSLGSTISPDKTGHAIPFVLLVIDHLSPDD